MRPAPAIPPQSVNDRASAAEWQTRVDLAACYHVAAVVTKSAQGIGGALAWPALPYKLDLQDSGYKS